MKNFILIFSLLVSYASFADVSISTNSLTAIDKLAAKYTLSVQAKEYILDTLYEGLFETSAGDDGMECQTELIKLAVLKESATSFSISYETRQDTSVNGCMDIPAQCFSTISLKPGSFKKTTSCKFY